MSDTIKVKVVSAKEFDKKYRAKIWYRHLVGKIITVKKKATLGMLTDEPLYAMVGHTGGTGALHKIYGRDLRFTLTTRKVRTLRCL